MLPVALWRATLCAATLERGRPRTSACDATRHVPRARCVCATRRVRRATLQRAIIGRGRTSRSAGISAGWSAAIVPTAEAYARTTATTARPTDWRAGNAPSSRTHSCAARDGAAKCGRAGGRRAAATDPPRSAGRAVQRAAESSLPRRATARRGARDAASRTILRIACKQGIPLLHRPLTRHGIALRHGTASHAMPPPCHLRAARHEAVRCLQRRTEVAQCEYSEYPSAHWLGAVRPEG